MSPILQPDLREAVARIICPTGFQLRDEIRRTDALPPSDAPPVELSAKAEQLSDSRIAEAVAKADAILGLVSSTGWSGDQSSVAPLASPSVASPSLATEPATPSTSHRKTGVIL